MQKLDGKHGIIIRPLVRPDSTYRLRSSRESRHLTHGERSFAKEPQVIGVIRSRLGWSVSGSTRSLDDWTPLRDISGDQPSEGFGRELLDRVEAHLRQLGLDRRVGRRSGEPIAEAVHNRGGRAGRCAEAKQVTISQPFRPFSSSVGRSGRWAECVRLVTASGFSVLALI